MTWSGEVRAESPIVRGADQGLVSLRSLRAYHRAMRCAAFLVSLLMSADGSLDAAHAAFMKARLEPTRQTESFRELKDELSALDARWEDLAKKGPPAETLRALVRQGQLRWHFAEEISRTRVPPEIHRLGEEAEATFADAIAANVASQRKAAKARWTSAAALASKHHVSSPEFESVRALMK